MLDWFQSYFSKYRSQCVFENGVESIPYNPSEGVPQGSVMGPLYFIMYTAPLEDIIERNGFRKMIYADDSQIYATMLVKDRTSVMPRFEKCLKEVKEWSTLNSLKLNVEKTEVLHIRSSRKRSPELSNMKVADVDIKPVSKARDLGVIVESDLDMTNHVNNICKVASFGLYRIGRIRKYLDEKTTEQLVHAFITSHLDNNNALLYGIQNSLLNKLQRIQNAAARLVAKKGKFEHISNILQSLHWLPVKSRIEFKLLVLVFKCVYGSAPGYLRELIQLYEPHRNLRSQSKNLLVKSRVNTKMFGDRAFQNIAPELWNSLPQHLRDIDNLDSFKSQLKTHLFSQQFS